MNPIFKYYKVPPIIHECKHFIGDTYISEEAPIKSYWTVADTEDISTYTFIKRFIESY